MVDSLLLNNTPFSYEQIGRKEFDVRALTEFEAHTLDFCVAWLNGAEQFELSTSGSTGKPKKIIIKREQMEASAALTIQKFGLESGDKVLVCIDTRYIGGKMMLVRSFEADMRMTIVTPSSNPLKELSTKDGFDFIALVPMQLQIMLENLDIRKEILDGMKAIIVGGGAVNKKLEESIQKVKAPVYSTYGMTETVSHIALKKINDPEKADYYKAFPGVTLSQDERGCLTISGPMTNGEAIVTNDVVTLLEENKFQWEGRVDNVINSGGIKINVEKLEREVEEVFLKQAIKDRFFLAGMDDELLSEKLVLVVEGKPLSSDQEQLLMNDLKNRLPAYHYPKAIHYLTQFIETNTGKIQRNKNIEKLGEML